MCGNNDKDHKAEDRSSASSPTTTAEAVAAAPVVPVTPEAPSAPSGVTFSTEPGSAGDVVFAEFEIHDNLTKGMIKRGAQMKTVEILQYARGNYPQASRVVVQGKFPMKDQYGNTSTDTILNAVYTRETLDKINFGGIDTDQIWEIRDSGMVHPELQ